MLDRAFAGELSVKHHVALRGPDGAVRHEECLTRKGFDGAYSILYHLDRPHPSRIIEARHGWAAPTEVEPRPLARRHLVTGKLPEGGAPVDARRPLVFNRDVIVNLVRPSDADPVYVNNADADELLFIHEGAGVLRTAFGDLRFEALDYVFIPKGVIHRLLPDPGLAQRWLSIECVGGMSLLSKWRNDVGQLRMDAPYSHRDFRRPVFAGPRDERLRELVVKREGRFHAYELVNSPLDVVGWDGAVYPWVFPILAFQPRTSTVHLPPDWHGTFATRGALICSFVPRAVDYFPDAIPCPYPHSSVDCDEVLFYCQGNFTSRKGVGPGSLSLHPYGIPHGPHPGSYEGSIGSVRTDELAVMVDTFKPLRMTQHAIDVEDAGYHDSFDG